MRKSSIGKRPQRRGELAAWYGAILEGQIGSGLSLKAYAERIGMSAWTLYDWRRRLGPGGDAAPAKAPTLIEVAVKHPRTRIGTGFVVRVCDGRRSIAVPAGFDGDELRRVVVALESC